MAIIIITYNYIITFRKVFILNEYFDVMKRKINRVGQNTLTVSLPTKWAQKHGLKQGDEVEVEEEGSSIIIGTAHKPQKLDITIDLSDAGVMLNRTIAAIYKAGYDRANISYKTPSELEVIQNTVYRACHVYEIMNIKKNVVEIKSISELNHLDFNSVFRKMAHAILTISQETYEAAKNQNYEELSVIILKDKVVDRHADFCRRVINKNHELDYERIGPLYVIAEQTEIAADIFKIISKELIKNRIKLSPAMLHLFSEVHMIMEQLYDMIHDFNIDKIRKIGHQEVKLREEIDELCKTQKKDIKVLAYLINMFETLFEMKSAVITLHIGIK